MAFELLVADVKSKAVRGTAMVRIAITKNKSSGIRRGVITLADSMYLKYFKDNAYATVFEGTGDDAGLLEIRSVMGTTPGAVKVGTFAKGGGRIYMPNVVASMPDSKFGTLPCQLVTEAQYSFIIKLPTEQWAVVKTEPEETAVDPHPTFPPPSVKDVTVVKPMQVPKNEGIPITTKVRPGFQPAKNIEKVRIARTAPPRSVPEEFMYTLDGTLVKDENSVIKPAEYLGRKGYTLTKLPERNAWQVSGEPVESDVPLKVSTLWVVDRINSYRQDSGLPPIGEHQLVDEFRLLQQAS